MNDDLWRGFGFARLVLTQGEHTLTAPIHDESGEMLYYLAMMLDRHLLDDAGCVLPSRSWCVERG